MEADRNPQKIPAGVLAAVAEVTRAIPANIVDAIADRLRREPPAGSTFEEYILGAMNQEGTRARIHALLAIWRSECPGVSAVAVAAALEAAAATHEWHRKNLSLDLVWTGPVPHGTSLRRTDQALLEVIRAARERLLVVSFAAYRVPILHDALIEAAERGVVIDFVLESRSESQGRLASEPVDALGPDLARRSTLWAWPYEERPRDDRGRHGVLHAKCALADEAVLFISSANLTADALQLNMELGVLVEGGRLPGEVAAHFDALKACGLLRCEGAE